MKNKIKEFNMIILGVGGQGQITLLQILAEASLSENYDIKTSELHGLSQRGGSVEVQVRFGKKIFSPLIAQAEADLVLALEMQEALRGLYYVNDKTKFLINKFLLPIPNQPLVPEKEILKKIRNFTHSEIVIIPANEICKKEFSNEILAGVYLISLASFEKLIPLKPSSILKAIKKKVPEKYLELNLRAFELAKRNS